jgi:hypothetical protein
MTGPADKDVAQLTVVPWPGGAGLPVLRLSAGLDERLPDGAVGALIAAGYRELA